MGSAAARLGRLGDRADVGRRVAGAGVPVDRRRARPHARGLRRARPECEELIAAFTGMSCRRASGRAPGSCRAASGSAPTSGLQRLLEPLAERIEASTGSRAEFRRKALGVQVGGLLGYVAARCSASTTSSCPPTTRGCSTSSVRTSPRPSSGSGSRTATSGCGSPCTRSRTACSSAARRGCAAYLRELVDMYFGTVQLDSKELMHAAPAGRRGGASRRGLARRRRLLPAAHARAARDVLPDAVGDVAARGPRLLRDERARARGGSPTSRGCAVRCRRAASRSSLERTFQRAIGFESKIKQYDAGEYFVRTASSAPAWRGSTSCGRDRRTCRPSRRSPSRSCWLARVAGD